MKTWSGTARRLFIAFATLITVYGLASSIAVVGLAEIHGGLHRTRMQADGVRVALELASAVRDQYAHQAHTIIIGDDSHLGFYAQAEKRVLDLTLQVRQRVERPEDKAWVEDIEQATAELDGIFRQRIVPAVRRGDRAEVRAEHARAQRVVSRIQERADRLVEGFERSIGDFQEHVNSVEHRTFRWNIFFLLGAPLLAIAVGISVGRSVARPVARLQEGAERLARGDLDTRIEIDSPDEFGALARQFNVMTESLKEHQQKLVQSEKLAGTGRLAAGVAQINNPLGVILGYTRLLRKKADGALAEDLGVIEEETLRCKEIVEGLLDLSRPLKTGTARPTDLRELCSEVVGRLVESQQLDGVVVAVQGCGTVNGDAQQLRQVLLNLIRNGIEAAGSDGRVDLCISGTQDQVEVVVSDSGPGIDPAMRERLFEPFFTTKPRGTGLGLAVSQAIARAHGGEILASSAPGGGARFSLRLPRAG